MNNKYDLILVGSSFASTFFLLEYLKRQSANSRVLVLEWGLKRSHKTILETNEWSHLQESDTFTNHHPHKRWVSHIVFGGNSNCWWAGTPRMLPSDFTTRSTYGVGTDWPITYEDLETYYCDAEEIMSVSGPNDHGSLFPRSRPYPQSAHLFNEPDKLIKAAYPTEYFVQPSARPRVATSQRAACCASGRCYACPADAKFTIANELMSVYDDPRVELLTNAQVRELDFEGGRVSGVVFNDGQVDRSVRSELVGLGAGAIFNPTILLRSGLSDQLIGKALNEQSSLLARVMLDGVNNFSGSTSVTGHCYKFSDGDFRKERAGVLIEHFNVPELRMTFGRWAQAMTLNLIFEDIPTEENHIRIDQTGKPETVWVGYSDYTQRALDHISKDLEVLLKPLPVESVEIASELTPTDSHIHGTHRMGSNPLTSVTDDRLKHHKYTNLLLLGSGSFPTCPAANPTLTLCALSLRAARLL